MSVDRLYEWPGDDAPIEVLCLPVSALYGKTAQEPGEPDEEEKPLDSAPRRKRSPGQVAAHERQITRLCLAGWAGAEISSEIGLNRSTVEKTIRKLGLSQRWAEARKRGRR